MAPRRSPDVAESWVMAKGPEPGDNWLARTASAKPGPDGPLVISVQAVRLCTGTATARDGDG